MHRAVRRLAALVGLAAAVVIPASASGTSSTGTQHFTVAFTQTSGLPANVDQIVQNAGGTITAKLPEVGGIAVDSSNPNFATDIAKANSVKAVTLQVTPEQAEKLALAANEGKLQLVMRNQIDHGDEQTSGVNKRSLLSGEAAMKAPEPGSLKSEQPKQEVTRPAVRRSAPVSKPAEAPAAPQATPRASVEMIEGAKKRSVDFP